MSLLRDTLVLVEIIINEVNINPKYLEYNTYNVTLEEVKLVKSELRHILVSHHNIECDIKYRTLDRNEGKYKLMIEYSKPV